MLLNAHTFTRSFRELQYDLRVFLEAVSRICPIGSSERSIIEAKWSDGSVSVAPITPLVQAFVGGKFPKMYIGDASLVVDTDKTGHVLFIQTENGVSLKFDSLTANELQVVSTVINRLIVTTDVHLAPDVLIDRLDITGDVSAILVQVLTKTTVTNQLMTDNMTVGRLDLSSIPIYSRMRVDPNTVEQSSYVYTYSREPVFNDKLVVDGPVCFNYETPTNESALQDNLVVLYHIPSKPYSNYSLWPGAKYDRSGVSFTSPFTGIRRSSDSQSTADIVRLYPRKYIKVYPTNKYQYNVMVDMPTADDSNRVVQVCNPTGEAYKVCNVWRFMSAIVDGVPQGRVSPVKYVMLPPYSSVDFLFDFELVSESVYAYMLPMTILE